MFVKVLFPAEVIQGQGNKKFDKLCQIKKASFGLHDKYFHLEMAFKLFLENSMAD